MNKILVLQSPPANGKSTFARNFVKDKDDWVIVSRDDIRESTGKYWVPSRESYISDVEEFQIRAAIKRNLNVIIDATNLNPKTIDKWNKLAEELNAEIEFKQFLIPFNEAYHRDKNRERKVGKAVLERFYKTYFPNESRTIIKDLPQTVERFIANQDQTLPQAIIVDIDGTLALMNGRGAFEYDKVDTDLPNMPVIDLVNHLSKTYRLIIVSGREGTEVCRKKTMSWLNRYIYSDSNYLLFMRKVKDYRKDSIVKEEIYNDFIKDKYYVVAVFDDRDQVVNDTWRKLGLLCNQVWKGDF